MSCQHGLDTSSRCELLIENLNVVIKFRLGANPRTTGSRQSRVSDCFMFLEEGCGFVNSGYWDWYWFLEKGCCFRNPCYREVVLFSTMVPQISSQSWLLFVLHVSGQSLSWTRTRTRIGFWLRNSVRVSKYVRIWLRSPYRQTQRGWILEQYKTHTKTNGRWSVHHTHYLVSVLIWRPHFVVAFIFSHTWW